MAVDPAIGRIVERVRAGLPETIERSVSTTFRDVPAYPASPASALRANLRAHTETVFEAVLTSISEGRPASRADFPLTAEHALLRIKAGIALSDFLQGFRIGQVSLWGAIVEAANPERATRDAAVDLAINVMHVIEVGSSMAAEAYMEAQQNDLAEGDRLSRDVVDDLVAGRTVTPGPKAELLFRAGLGDQVPVIVAVGVVVEPLPDESRLREVLSTVRAMLGPGERGIATIRQDDVVGVIPASTSGREVVAVIERAQRILAGRGIDLGVGLSTVHSGVRATPEAHREAVIAHRGLAGSAGVGSLSALGPLGYLTLMADDTASRLVRPEVRALVEDDRKAGGSLVETLRTYAESDLNAKIAAERLHVHVNTAYYRIDQIAERTGCDPRRFADLQELLLGIRLLESSSPPR